MTAGGIGLFITGNEILNGKIKDTNSYFISSQLKKYGLAAKKILVCGDDRSELIDGLRYLAKHCDTILMTGGLGPTSDDLTAEVVAAFLGKEIKFYPDAWQNCVNTYTRMGLSHVPEVNKKQAYLPNDSVIIPNQMGTAAGFMVGGVPSSENLNSLTTVFCMPGVPYEMEGMMIDFVIPKLSKNSRNAIVKTWKVFSMGESVMQENIKSAEDELKSAFPNCAVSYQAHAGYVTYSVSNSSDNNGNSSHLVGEYLNQVFSPKVRDAFKHFILYEDDKAPTDFLQNLLSKKEMHLVFMEVSPYGHWAVASQDLLEWIFSWGQMEIAKQKSNIGILKYELVEPDNSGEKQKQFYFMILLDRNKIINTKEIALKLEPFGWQIYTSQGFSSADVENGYFGIYCKKKFNPKFSQEVLQERAKQFCICSLVVASQAIV